MKKSMYILFAVALIIFVVALFFYRKSFRDIRLYADLINKSHEVITGFERLSSDLKAAQIFSEEFDSADIKGLVEVYKINAGNISGDLAHLREHVLDPLNKRRLDTLSNKIETQIDWITRYDIGDTLLHGRAPERVAELFAIQKLIDSSGSRAKVVLAERRQKFETNLSLSNIYILAFRVFSLLILLSTILLVILHARQKEKGRAFLDSVLNSSQNAIISYEAIRKKGEIVDFKIVYANEATRSNGNMDPAEIVGKTLLELEPDMKTNGVLEKFCKVAQTSQKLRYEITVRNETYDVLLAKFSDGVTASFFNITQLRNAGEELEKKIVELEQSNYELEQYAYVASHDLQEPLRKIRIFGGLILDQTRDKLDSTNQAYLQRMIEAAERMTILINELLKFSRLFKPDQQLVQVDLNEVLENVLKDFDLMIQEKRLEIIVGKLPVIQANVLHMNQLFYNLIHNALKFSNSTVRSRIEISSHQLTADELARIENLNKRSRYYEIIFKDNGIGFNQEFATQIFEIFKRLNEQHFYPGSGIGLALCRKIILNHHGLIWAEGEEGKGAIFHVILPVEQPNAIAS